MPHPHPAAFLPDWLQGQERALVTQTYNALLDHRTHATDSPPGILDQLRATDVALCLLHVHRAEAEFNNPKASLDKTLTHAGRARDRLRKAITAFEKSLMQPKAAPAVPPQENDFNRLQAAVAAGAGIAEACCTEEAPQDDAAWYGETLTQAGPDPLNAPAPPRSTTTHAGQARRSIASHTPHYSADPPPSHASHPALPSAAPIHLPPPNHRQHGKPLTASSDPPKIKPWRMAPLPAREMPP